MSDQAITALIDQLRLDADNLREVEDPRPAMLRDIADRIEIAARLIDRSE